MKKFWQSFVATLKRGWDWFSAWILGPGAALIVMAVVVLLVFLGVRNLEVGGLLSKLLGKKDAKKPIEVVNTPPKKRVDEDGKIIPPGTPDQKGMTQAVVVPIEKNGIFDDPTQVKIIPPGETKPVKIDLPEGVKRKDVDKVIIVQPDEFAVTVKNDSGVKASDVDDLLAKYGGI